VKREAYLAKGDLPSSTPLRPYGTTQGRQGHQDGRWPFYEAGKNVRKRLKTFKNIQIFCTPLRELFETNNSYLVKRISLEEFGI